MRVADAGGGGAAGRGRRRARGRCELAGRRPQDARPGADTAAGAAQQAVSGGAGRGGAGAGRGGGGRGWGGGGVSQLAAGHKTLVPELIQQLAQLNRP